MKQVTLHEAKTHLSRLVDLALSGEEIIIARRSQPLVRLQVIQRAQTARSVGSMRGLVLSMGDSFNESLEDWETEVVPQPSKRSRGRR